MIKPISLLLILTSCFAYSQQKVSGIIKDATTLEPIPYVNIYSSDETGSNYTGTISNDDGQFTINDLKTAVVFSHLNYEEITLEAGASFQEVLLTPKSYILDKVVLSNEEPKDYLKRLLKLSTQKLDKDMLLKSYCREIVKVNNDYTKYADALVDYYVKKGNGKANITLGSHRALVNDKLTGPDTNIAEQINSTFKIRNYVKDGYSFAGLENILKSKNYEFVRKIRREANGAEYELVEIIPSASSDKMLLKGYVIIDTESNSVAEVKLYTSEDHLKNAKLMNLVIAKGRLNNVLKWTKFRIINGKYILTYNKVQANMYIKMGKYVDDNFDFMSDVFVYEFKSDVAIPKNGYKNKTIFEAGTSYTNHYWELYNVYPLSEELERFTKTATKL